MRILPPVGNWASATATVSSNSKKRTAEDAFNSPLQRHQQDDDDGGILKRFMKDITPSRYCNRSSTTDSSATKLRKLNLNTKLLLASSTSTSTNNDDTLPPSKRHKLNKPKLRDVRLRERLLTTERDNAEHVTEMMTDDNVNVDAEADKENVHMLPNEATNESMSTPLKRLKGSKPTPAWKTLPVPPSNIPNIKPLSLNMNDEGGTVLDTTKSKKSVSFNLSNANDAETIPPQDQAEKTIESIGLGRSYSDNVTAAESDVGKVDAKKYLLQETSEAKSPDSQGQALQSVDDVADDDALLKKADTGLYKHKALAVPTLNTSLYGDREGIVDEADNGSADARSGSGLDTRSGSDSNVVGKEKRFGLPLYLVLLLFASCIILNLNNCMLIWQKNNSLHDVHAPNDHLEVTNNILKARIDVLQRIMIRKENELRKLRVSSELNKKLQIENELHDKHDNFSSNKEMEEKLASLTANHTSAVQQMTINHANEMKQLNTTYLKDIEKLKNDLHQSNITIEKQGSKIKNMIHEADVHLKRNVDLQLTHSREMELKEQKIEKILHMYDTFREEEIERVRFDLLTSQLQSEYEEAAKRAEESHTAELNKVRAEASSMAKSTSCDSEAAARDNEEDAVVPSSFDEAAIVEQQSSSDMTKYFILCSLHPLFLPHHTTPLPAAIGRSLTKSPKLTVDICVR